MVDTIRGRAALLALLADNVTENVSPQDMRDLLVSLDVYGNLTATPLKTVTFPAGVGTVLTSGDLWAATGTLSSGVTVNTTAGTMTVGTTGKYRVHFNVSAEIPDGGVVPTWLCFALAKNGADTGFPTGAAWFGVPTASPASPATDKRIHSASFEQFVECNANDVLTILKSASQANVVTIWFCNWTVERYE